MKERIYTTYSEESDITFIMKQISENSVLKSEEVVGFHWGKETENSTKEFMGNLKATFND